MPMLLVGLAFAQSHPGALPASRPVPRFHAATSLVLVNVSVRDSHGRFVRGLHPGDFQIYENGRRQAIASFDVIDLARPPQPQPALAAPPHIRRNGMLPVAKTPLASRWIVILVDSSTMRLQDWQRTRRALLHFVRRQLKHRDRVAMVRLDHSLQVLQSFTQSRKKLWQAVAKLGPSPYSPVSLSTQGGEVPAPGNTTLTDSGASLTGQTDTEAGAENGSPAGEQDYLNSELEDPDLLFYLQQTNRRLRAIETICRQLSAFPQQKALIFFTGGGGRIGQDNLDVLQAGIDAATRANVSLYTVDSRGLQADAGFSARSRSIGMPTPSGASIRTGYLAKTRDMLFSLAGNTGGKAFVNSNDLNLVFTRVHRDLGAYYLLGYHSSDPVPDGKFRKITVRVDRRSVRLRYRRGYIMPPDFRHMTAKQRDRELQMALAEKAEMHQLRLAVSTDDFLLRPRRYLVRTQLMLPPADWSLPNGAASIPAGQKHFDLAGAAYQAGGKIVSSFLSQVPFPLSKPHSGLQCNGSFQLPPGKYKLKFVVRNEVSGRIGTVISSLQLPDWYQSAALSRRLRISSVVFSNRLQPARHPAQPPVFQGRRYIPNPWQIFSQSRPVYLYFEVYNSMRSASGGIHVVGRVGFLQGKKLVYLTPALTVRHYNASGRSAIIFTFAVPARQLPPGNYNCAVLAVDMIGRQLIADHLPLRILP